MGLWLIFALLGQMTAFLAVVFVESPNLNQEENVEPL